MVKDKPSTSDRKLGELMLYLAWSCEKDPWFGAVKLNKLLFFSDFDAYVTLGQSITGASYQKLPLGPAPVRLLPVRAVLEKERRAVLRKRALQSTDCVQDRLTPLDPPDLSLFTPAEIAIVEKTIRRLNGMSGADVSDLSHEFWGWEAAAMNEVIPYETALVPVEPLPLPQRAMDRLKQLANE